MSEEVNYSVGQLLEAINNKADLDGSNLDNTSFETFINSLVDAKLGNIDYVVESKLPTAEDPTWYRLYKSGWVEQGGYVAGAFDNQIINLIKEMKTDHYNIIITKKKDGGGNYGVSYNNPTPISFSCSVSSEAVGCKWQVSGQSA